MKRSVVAAAAFSLLTACSLSQDSSSGSGGPSGSPAATPTGQLSDQVPMPATFPGDVPIYPSARLIAAAGFPSGGPTSWGMEWETKDSVAKVQLFYQQNFNKGDWTIAFNAGTSDGFAATFARKSNTQVNGTVAATSAGGVTKIEMSLLSPPG